MTTKNIVCVKQGKKYSSEYVNKLYEMTQRNCSLSHNFFCITDDSKKLSDEIKTVDLPKNVKGWWSKLYLFSPELPIEGTILYFDLDVVISGSIDKLFTYEPERWCIIRDFTRSMKPQWQGFNSSVMRFQKNENRHIWDYYKKNQEHVTKRYPGDQDLIYYCSGQNPPVFWPDDWIKSWKWEIRSSKEVDRKKRKGERPFLKKEKVKPPKKCCVVVFHGDPNPSYCDDPWIVNHWG